MDKMSSANYVIKLTFVLLFFSLLLFPICLMALDGPDQTEVGSEAATELEAFSVDSYLSGEFQNAFTSWFSAHYPLRSSMVTTYRQTKYNIDNSDAAIHVLEFLDGSLWRTEDPTKPVIPTDPTNPDDPTHPDDPATPVTDPWAVYLAEDNIYRDINLLQMMQEIVEPRGFKGNDSVYIGKSGYLFERSYMDEYMGYSSPYTAVTDEGMMQNIKELEYIQEELAKRGITMLYVISSSKASQYADYIPDWYKNSHTAKEGYVRPIERYRKMLAESSIHYLDSSEYYKEIGLLVTFPKTGIHWNLLASGETTCKLVDMFAEISGANLKRLDITGFTSQSTPINFGNPEQDVYNILYNAVPDAAGKIVDNAYYKPVVEVKNQDAPAVNLLIQGGSFCDGMIPFFRTYGVANVTQIYYSGTQSHGSIAGHSFWQDDGTEQWEYWLKDKQFVLFEATEQQIRGGHYEGDDWAAAVADPGNLCGHDLIYDSLYRYLKDHEGEY